MLFDEGDDKMVKTEAFPTIRMKIDRLLKITNEYQFNDLVKAVWSTGGALEFQEYKKYNVV